MLRLGLRNADIRAFRSILEFQLAGMEGGFNRWMQHFDL